MATQKQRQARNAAALIEMALVLPILIVVVLICVDLGRFATVHTAVTNAAREGASFGGTHRFTPGTFDLWKQKINETVTTEVCGIPGYSAQNLSISEPEVIASQKRARVRVEVSYKFKPAVIWPLLPHELNIAQTAEMPVVR